MKKTIIVILSVVVLIALIILSKWGIEYLATVYRIKESETYNSNQVIIKYSNESYKVKIPKGLGDMELKGHVRFCFKTTKSLDKIKNEFRDLYGEQNVVEKDDTYYYVDREEKYVIAIRYGNGFFTDVTIVEIKSINL